MFPFLGSVVMFIILIFLVLQSFLLQWCVINNTHSITDWFEVFVTSSCSVCCVYMNRYQSATGTVYSGAALQCQCESL